MLAKKEVREGERMVGWGVREERELLVELLLGQVKGD